MGIMLTPYSSPMTFGAVIIILSLASDTFIQQIIQLDVQPSYLDAPVPTVAKAKNYSRVLDGSDTPAFSMIEAITVGLGANGPLNTTLLTVACSTGDCGFESFNTLAVCSNCSDITSMLTVGTNTLPAGYDGTFWSYQDIMLGNTNQSLREDAYVWNFTIGNYTGKSLEIATFMSINVTDVDSVFNWPNSTLRAEQCILSYCIQSI